MFGKNINITKRISAFLLALIMLLGALPLNVFAEAIHGNNDSAIVESNTTNKEKPSSEPKGTDPEKHTISFNPNGGTGDMESVEVAEGEEYSLPKNKFKAPERKEFKSWLMDKEELKEGHKLVVNKDIELKANWKDTKVNPVKKALNSLIGKDDKEELDVSNVNVGNAVMAGDNTTEGDPEGTVTSKDGKTRITNFEAHWVGTNENTVLGTTLDGGYYKFDLYENSKSTYGKVINNNNTKLQVKYVVSGERLYEPGMIKIKLPYYSRAEGYPESYVEASNIPIPKAKIVGGKIDYNADYGKAEYIYYIDGDDMVVTNTTTIPAATSGTFLIDYLFPNVSTIMNDGKLNKAVNDDIRNMPDMYKFKIDPQISIDINNEETISKDSHKLYHQVDKIISGGVGKFLVEIDAGKKEDETEIFEVDSYNRAFPDYGPFQKIHDWKPEWGDNLKPKNYEDYYYMIYEIRALVGSAYSNASLKIEDILGENQGQEIIGYQFGNRKIDRGG